VLVALAWVSAGCGDSRPFQGRWVGDRGIQAGPGDDPSVAVTLSRVRLEITGDRFTLTEEGFTKEGRAAFGRGDATLTVTTILKKSVKELGQGGEAMAGTRTLRTEPDGSLRFERPGSAPLRLIRDATSRPDGG
jgi:hypothetical protein